MTNPKESNRFGSRVRWLRESFFLRTTKLQGGGPTPRMRLSGLALIECLKQAGHELSSGQLSEIETGRNMPRDIDSFLLAISSCLQVEEEILELLRADLAFDLVARRFGLDFAERHMRPMTYVGQTMRRYRHAAGLSIEQLAKELAKRMAEAEARPPRGEKADKLADLTNTLAQHLARIEDGGDFPFEDDATQLIRFLNAFSLVFDDENARPALVFARASDRFQPVSADDLSGDDISPSAGPMDRTR